MMVTLTPVVWTLRCGDCHAIYGDDFNGVATVVRAGSVAHVSGAFGSMPIKEQVNLTSLLRDMGFEYVEFDRKKGDKFVTLRRKL